MASTTNQAATDGIAQTNGATAVEKDTYLHDHHDPESALQKLRQTPTAETVTLSASAFETNYLQPLLKGVKHPLARVFGNPTPLGIIGFEMSLMPVTMDLMGWRGASGDGASDIAQLIFFGGVLLWTAGLLEFFLANTFPCLVFMSFGSFYAAYAGTLMPLFGALAAFAKDHDPYSGNPYTGLKSPAFNASYGHFWVAFTILMFFFLICTLRTNVLFFLLFITITPGVGCIAGIFYNAAAGNAAAAHNCQIAAGALLFATCMFGWYLFAGLVFPTVDFPIPIPLGDLSGVVPPLSSFSTKPFRFGRKKKSESEMA